MANLEDVIRLKNEENKKKFEKEQDEKLKQEQIRKEQEQIRKEQEKKEKKERAKSKVKGFAKKVADTVTGPIRRLEEKKQEKIEKERIAKEKEEKFIKNQTESYDKFIQISKSLKGKKNIAKVSSFDRITDPNRFINGRLYTGPAKRTVIETEQGPWIKTEYVTERSLALAVVKYQGYITVPGFGKTPDRLVYIETEVDHQEFSHGDYGQTCYTTIMRDEDGNFEKSEQYGGLGFGAYWRSMEELDTCKEEPIFHIFNSEFNQELAKMTQLDKGRE